MVLKVIVIRLNIGSRIVSKKLQVVHRRREYPGMSFMLFPNRTSKSDIEFV